MPKKATIRIINHCFYLLFNCCPTVAIEIFIYITKIKILVFYAFQTECLFFFFECCFEVYCLNLDLKSRLWTGNSIFFLTMILPLVFSRCSRSVRVRPNFPWKVKYAGCRFFFWCKWKAMLSHQIVLYNRDDIIFDEGLGNFYETRLSK